MNGKLCWKMDGTLIHKRWFVADVIGHVTDGSVVVRVQNLRVPQLVVWVTKPDLSKIEPVLRILEIADFRKALAHVNKDVLFISNTLNVLFGHEPKGSPVVTVQPLNALD